MRYAIELDDDGRIFYFGSMIEREDWTTRFHNKAYLESTTTMFCLCCSIQDLLLDYELKSLTRIDWTI